MILNLAFLRRQSIKTRITLFTLIIFLVGVWPISFFASQLLRKDMEKMLGEQQFSTVSVIGATVNKELDERLKALGTIAGEITPAVMKDAASLQTHLEQRPLLQLLFNGGVDVVGPDGTVIADVPLASGRMGRNYIADEWISAALKEGRSAISRPMMGPALHAPVFAMTVPIRDSQGKVIGTLNGVVNLGKPNFLDLVTENHYGKTGDYVLSAPKYRLIITASNKSRVMEQLPAPGLIPTLDHFMEGHDGYAVYVNPLGVEVLGAGVRIPIADWTMSSILPTEEAFAPIRAVQRHMLAATSLLTLLACGLIWLLMRAMLRRQLLPMIVATRTLDTFSDSGNKPQLLAVTSQDEIGQMISSFNRLLKVIESRESTLKLSEENLSITLGAIGDGVIATDVDGRVTRINGTAERLSGWTLSDAIGRRLSEIFRIVNADTREPVADPFQLVMEREQVVGLANHTVLLAKDGQEYQIADSAAPIRNAEGKIVGVVLVFSDVTEKYRVEKSLREEQLFSEKLLDSLPGIFYLYTYPEIQLVRWNKQHEILLGYGAEEMKGRLATDWFLPDVKDAVANAIRGVMEKGFDSIEAPMVAKDGHLVHLYLTGVKLESQGRSFFVGTGTDITERKQAELQLRIAATAFESQEGMTITNAAGVILRVNKAFSAITGYSADEVIGRNPRLLHSGRQDAAFYAEMWSTITRTGSWAGEIWNRRKDGKAYPEWLSITAVKNEEGIVTHYVGSFADITTRKSAEDEIAHLAFYDHLTHLPNRRLMMDRLGQALTGSARHGRHGAVMLIDLDYFKTLNDTLGHAVGDQLLVEVAARMASCIREGDTVARLGGDEFVVILEDLDQTGQAALQAEGVALKIQAKFTEPYQLDIPVGEKMPSKRNYRCTASIGITLFRDHSVSADELMKRADTAMYQSKSKGRNTLCFFDPEMQAAVHARAALEADLRNAITEEQFLLHYQAQVDSAGRAIGAEALVRWRHPERGLVSPAEFIPLAEETGLIIPLGYWVLKTACLQLAAWAKHPVLTHLTVAVNVSARQFHDKSFVDMVWAVLDLTEANPHRLKLELTESLLVQDVQDTIEKMFALKSRGVGFSLDDFGTGYSSLAYLKRLPLDQLKIDQSFVHDVLTDANDAAIARTIVTLAQSLGFSVIAEGVETAEQRNFLAESGCHTYQGFFFSRPLPIDRFEQFARRE